MADYEIIIQDAISLYYEDKGAGQPVVLLHGFCGTHAYWKYVTEELSKYYRVIAIDLRGHGKSAVSEDTFSIEDMANDVQLLLAKLQINYAAIIGHSLGGYVALAIAENHENILSGLGLIHSTPVSDSTEAKQGRDRASQRIQREGMKGFIDDLTQKLFSPQNAEDFKGEVEFARQLGYQTKVSGAVGTLEAMKNREDRQAFLEIFNKPLLLVAGKGDQIIPVEKTFAALGENVQKVLLEHSGHMGMLEEPQAVIDAFNKFLKNIEKQ
jgi:pimeloyl-ACP methyl ester carboxylesterase